MTSISRWKISVLIVALCYTVAGFSTGYFKDSGNIIHSDVVEYYSYLPAFFVFKDVKMQFLKSDPEKFADKIRGKRLGNGNYVIKMSMGMSVLYSPLFFLGHLSSKSSSYPSDGFSLPYSASLAFGSLLYFIIGLIFTGKILSYYYADSVVALVLLLLSFATNVSYYLIREPAMSHTYSFMLFALFIHLVILWYQKQSLMRSVFLGLLIGLIALVRPTNVIIALVLVFWDVKSVADVRHRFRLFFSRYPQIICIGLCAVIVWVPQFMYWYQVTGSVLFYSYVDEGFCFTRPQIYQVLLSFRKGWFIYTPLMFFATLGFLLLYKDRKTLFWPLFLFLIVNMYVISSWWCWWYGGSYGHRAFIESYVVMAFPLASLIDHFLQRGRGFQVSIYVLSMMFVFHNALQLVKLSTGALHFDSMTRKAYFEVFYRLNPTPKYLDLLQKPDFNRAKSGLSENTDDK